MWLIVGVLGYAEKLAPSGSCLLIDVEKTVTAGKVAACIAGVMAVVSILSACDGPGSDVAPNKPKSAVKRNPAVGEDLRKAIQGAIRSGLGYSVRDAENKGRFSDMKSPNQYEVCFERSVPELQAVMFYVVPMSTECPPKVGT
ncbi:hypothetical protein ACFXDF_23225 [Streptomyces sp. NPDC059426]|uniref:hypothetical protein n=1 Tax=Streptomyces sp. NPDC059426 TaxID=3346827 RepID=UPI0036B603AE